MFTIVLIALAYGVLAWTELLVARGQGRISAIWFPNAVAVAVILLKHNQDCLKIVLACLIANIFVNVMIGDVWQIALGLGLCNSVEILLAIVLITRLHAGSIDITEVTDLKLFALNAGIIAPAVSALCAVIIIDEFTKPVHMSSWFLWFATDGLGLLIVAPVIMILSEFKRHVIHQTKPFIVDTLFVAALCVLVVGIVFYQSRLPLPLAVTPIVIFAIFRLGWSGLALTIAIIIPAAIISTLNDTGPAVLVNGTFIPKWTFVQIYIITLCGIGVPVAVALNQYAKISGSLQANNDFMQSVMGLIDDIVVRTTLDGSITYISDHWLELAGVEAADCYGKPITAFITADRPELSAQESHLEILFKDGFDGRHLRCILKTAQGNNKYVQIRFRQNVDANGNLIGMVGSIHDIDAQYRSRLALLESEELHRYTLQLSRQIPWTADTLTKAMHFTPQSDDPAVADYQALFEGGWLAVTHMDDVSDLIKALQTAERDKMPFNRDFRVLAASGHYRHIRVNAAPRFNIDGRVLRWYGTITDVDHIYVAQSNLREIKLELIHVSRLSAMGAMATTLAHELNQPLAALTNYARGLRRVFENKTRIMPGMVIEILAEIESSALRAGEVVRRLRELVGKGNVERANENLMALVREACGLGLIDTQSRGIKYTVDFDKRAESVFVDRIQIQQVLINFMRNAVDALEGSKKREIIIATELCDTFCEVSVHDSGEGISEAIRDRIFSAFNTSKPDGMGIGLSICRTIIEAHGGTIWHDTGRLGGTAFHFTVPIA